MRLHRVLAGVACACILAFGLAACSSSEGASNPEKASVEAFSGVWELSQIDDGTRVIGEDEIERLAAMGMNVYAEFTADGKATVSLFDNADSGQWTPVSATEASMVLSDGQRIDLALSDGILSFSQGTDRLEFKRSDLQTIPAGALGGSQGVSSSNEQTIEMEPVTIVDDSLVTIVATAKRTDLVGTRGYMLTVTNNSDEAIRVKAEEDSFSVRGKMVEVSGGRVIQPGKYAEVFFGFDAESLGPVALEDLGDVEGTLLVTTPDGDRVLAECAVSL